MPFWGILTGWKPEFIWPQVMPLPKKIGTSWLQSTICRIPQLTSTYRCSLDTNMPQDTVSVKIKLFTSTEEFLSNKMAANHNCSTNKTPQLT